METSSTSETVTTVVRQTDARDVGLSKCVQRLIPGIPDDITLEKIFTRLPWRTFNVLSLVNPAWWKAIDSRQVYSARVRHSSTKTLLVHFHAFRTSIALYSTRDDCCYILPPLPPLGYQFSAPCECIGLDGKIYALGRRQEGERRGRNVTSPEVFVLDVAGRKKWKQCASMQDARLSFGCGISGGKIYVFGGRCDQMMVRGSEVYDPKVDAWSPVTTVGGELFADGGTIFNGDALRWDADHTHRGRDPMDSDADDNDEIRYHLVSTLSLQIYNPTTNEWRVVKDAMRFGDTAFVVKSDFLCMTPLGVDVYDMDKNLWTGRHTHCCPEIDQDTSHFWPTRCLAADKELFARVDCPTLPTLLLTRGFDSGQKEIQWHKIICPDLSYKYDRTFSITV